MDPHYEAAWEEGLIIIEAKKKQEAAVVPVPPPEDEDSNMSTTTRKLKVTKRQTFIEFLASTIKKHKVNDSFQLARIVRGDTFTLEEKDMCFKIMCEANFENMFQMAKTWVRAELCEFKFDEIVEEFQSRWHDNEDRNSYLTIEQTMGVLSMWFKNNGIEPRAFVASLYNILAKIWPKKNAFVLEGPVNSGKSMVARSIFALFQVTNEVQMSGNNQFAFQDAASCQLITIEEPAITPEYAEKMKLILEGAPTEVPVKHKSSQVLKRTPVFFTTNNPIWKWCGAQADAFKARMVHYKVRTMPVLRFVTKELNPMVWVLQSDQ